ncbi:AraC family transcriptional regulator [Paenibacillus sp. GCM10023252]|uniref:AraC family transcriptional regulator n=1 Tax=Paenibacillus sp. GCM10023252 TaxID=3252649 RepID=UPI003621DDD4
MGITEPWTFTVPTILHMADRHTYPSWSVTQETRSDYHNLMFIVSGSGTAYRDGQSTALHPGMLVYQPKGAHYGYATNPVNLMHCYGINFILTDLTGESSSQASVIDRKHLPLPTYSTVSRFDTIARMFGELAQTWSNKLDNSMMKCRSLFMLILHELLQPDVFLSENHPYRIRMRHVMDYIELNYARPITLSQLAELGGLSSSYFGQAFRAFTGMSPIEYVNQTRLLMAAKLMEQGVSIGEAASQCGFQDPFYFSRLFKKKKGISPSLYLKQQQFKQFF